MGEAELREFDERTVRTLDIGDVEYMCEPKLDGLAIELIYLNGVFAAAATRGDGYIGEEVTQNIKTIKSIPLQLRDTSAPVPERLARRPSTIQSC